MRVQRFRKGPVPRGDALWAPELLRRIARVAGVEFGWPNLNSLWRDLSAGEPSFAGIDPVVIGDLGAPAASSPRAGRTE